MLVKTSFFQHIGRTVSKVITYDLEVYWWTTESCQSQVPIRKDHIMSLVPQLPERQGDAGTHERRAEYRRQRHVPEVSAELLEIRWVTLLSCHKHSHDRHVWSVRSIASPRRSCAHAAVSTVWNGIIFQDTVSMPRCCMIPFGFVGLSSRDDLVPE